MAKTSGRKKEPVGGTKKELVIVTRPAVTPSQIEQDERKRNLLLLLSSMEEQGGVYERSLAHLVYWLQSEKGIDLGYNFTLVGDLPTSKELKEDLIALLYVGYAETDPRTKKIRISSDGKEFLSKVGYDKNFYEQLRAAVDELRPKIAAIDMQIELTTMLTRPRRRRTRI
ncbi:MAG: hypothetical protein ABWW70_01720 [Thermoproteota archaeon]